MKCGNCNDLGWVCENNDAVPWNSGAECSGAGMPCPKCNVPKETHKLNNDYGFALVCWSLVLAPTIIVIATGNVWYFALYAISLLVFGFA